MSSSRIIKGGTRDGETVTTFAYDTFGTAVREPYPAARGEFQPLFADDPITSECESEEAGGRGELEASDPIPDDGALPEIEAVPGPSGEELDRMLREAFDEGFADGRRQAEESLAGVGRTFSAAIDEVDRLRERIVRESEDDLLRLSIMIARQIVQQEIAMDRKILAQFVAEAIRGITDQDEIVICFSPDDCRVVSANRHLYLAGIADKQQITIKPDDSVPPGGCVVETATGLVDARVDAQLAEVFRYLMQERGRLLDSTLNKSIEAEPYLSEPYGVEKYGSP